MSSLLRPLPLREGRDRLMALSPKEMHAAILGNLAGKTGRGADEWLVLLRSEGPSVRRDRIAWLKGEHGLGNHTAVALVTEANGDGWGADDELLNALFAPHDAGIRARFDELERTVRGFGDDVRVVPCKTYVGFRRRRQFAVVRPGRTGVLEIGTALNEPGLEPTKGLGSARITAKVPEDQAERYLRAAYDADG